MYDVIVIGAGLSGLLAALTARKNGFSTAVVASGTGKLVQSTGLMDEIPIPTDASREEPSAAENTARIDVGQAVADFKKLVAGLGYPYRGEVGRPAAVVTGSGLLKTTALYPDTVAPVPEAGHALIVGFEELADFQPAFVRANLSRQRPKMRVDAIRIRLGCHSQRVMTQLDVAHLLDRKAIRETCVGRIRGQLQTKQIGAPDFCIFPAALGWQHWREVTGSLSDELGATITEAPGLPPNATAIRLNDVLREKAACCGVRFYENTAVSGGKIAGDRLQAIRIVTSARAEYLTGSQFILATGGILGGGLKMTDNGFAETALHLQATAAGTLAAVPKNVHAVGAMQRASSLTQPVVGGVYTIWSTLNALHQALDALEKTDRGGIVNV